MNRKIITSALTLGALVFMFACNSEKSADKNGEDVSTDVVNNPATASEDGAVGQDKLPQMIFEKEVHDFGEIVEGEKVSYSFKFTNTGKSDLIVSNASASCGCTVPEYSTDPIAPGEEGKIDVVFDSKNRPGKVDKKVTIIANTVPNTKVIKITGRVKSPVN